MQHFMYCVQKRKVNANKQTHAPSNKPLASRPLYFRARRIDLHRVELSRKKYKTAILFYCFHTAGVIHTFVLAPYNLLGPEILLIENIFFKII